MMRGRSQRSAFVTRTFLAWVPILGLLLLQLIPSASWCTPIEPGGRELACGYEYAQAGVRLAVDVVRAICALAFFGTLWLACRRRLSTWGLAGLVVSSLLFAVVVWSSLASGGIDTP